jgi:hypothetical protein
MTLADRRINILTSVSDHEVLAYSKETINTGSKKLDSLTFYARAYVNQYGGDIQFKIRLTLANGEILVLDP